MNETKEFLVTAADKPYAAACDNNREPILAVIAPIFGDCQRVLEIGSGTGQHAVYFGRRLPHLQWHTSDCKESHAGIRMWLDEAGLSNVLYPLDLDVAKGDWPDLQVDAVFSANTVHIMHWDEVRAFFRRVGRMLPAGGAFVLYGPINYGGRYTSASNARFDEWLKARDPQSGIRDFAALNELAENAGMDLQADYAMPANNRILHWEKGA